MCVPGAIHCWGYNSAEPTQPPILVEAALGNTAIPAPHLPPPHVLNAAEVMKTPTCDYFSYCLLLWGAACPGSVAAKERGMHYCTFSWHKKGFIITLALLPLPFLLIFSTLRANRAILFHFLIPLVRLHLACSRSF